MSKSFNIAEFIPKEATEEIWGAYFGLSEGIFRELNEKRRLPDRGVVSQSIAGPVKVEYRT